MGFKCGIVGLPNVGKSTLFNLLAKQRKAKAANFPFCTIEPNRVTVPFEDKRLRALAKIENSAKTLYSTLEFVDIAGLVKGASNNEGLGNKFLSHILEVDLIVHVLRCFNGDITHVMDRINPIEDFEVVMTELAMADLSRIQNMKKKADKDKLKILEKLETIVSANGRLDESLKNEIHMKHPDLTNFLSLKPIIILCNGDYDNSEDKVLINKVREHFKEYDVLDFPISTLEELSNDEDMVMSEEEKEEYFAGVNKLIYCGFRNLNLINYFTVGPQEARAWTIVEGTNTVEAAGKIHSSFSQKFIAAEVTPYSQYGKVNFKVVGKDYIVQDADVLYFRTNS